MSCTAQNHRSQPVETVRQFLALAVMQGHGAAARRDAHGRAAGHTRKAIHVDFATSAVNLGNVARKHVWVRMHGGRRLHEAAQIGTLRVGMRVGRGGWPVLF